MTTKHLGGRLAKKLAAPKSEFTDWKQRAHAKAAFIYMRFSTQEQREQNAYSLERQEGLKKLAIDNGAKSEFTSEEIAAITSKPSYPGWYQDGQIIVEERDLIGISGRKGQESRKGFAHLLASIERGVTGAVYAVDVTRLFRDEFLIMPTQFAKLCYDKGVFVITENAVFDMANEMQRRIFIMQAEYAAQELAMIQSRLGGSRRAKARSGRYAGDPVPVGYVVLPDETSSRLNDYAIYEPQAEVIRRVFQKTLELRRLQLVARWFNRNGLYIPAFESKFSYMENRSIARQMRKILDPSGQVKGYKVLRSTVGHLLCNPMYIGRIYREGELVKENPDLAIVSEETFWAIQSILEKNQSRWHERTGPHLLSGLLFCTKHGDSPSTVYQSGTGYRCSYEQNSGSTEKHCFIALSDILDVPVTQAVLGEISYADRADRVVAHLETELAQRQERATALRKERERLNSEKESLEESLALLKLRETDPEKRNKLREGIHKKIQQREQELEELAQQELAPFENVLTTTDVSMVRDFLGDLKSRWAEIPLNLRNNFLHVILDRILVTDQDDHFRLEILWRSGLKQNLIVFRPSIATKKRRWNGSEDAILKAHFGESPREELLQLLAGRGWSEITHRAVALRIKRKRAENFGKRNLYWTPEEDEVLRAFDREEISYWEMLRKLENRMYAGILRRCKILGISLSRRRIVWRFVDANEDIEQSRGAPFDGFACAPRYHLGTRAKWAVGKC